MTEPSPEAVRSALANFDQQRQKIVAGLLTVMIKNPQRVREREWVAEQLTQLTLLSGEFEADTPQTGVQAIQDFLGANGEELVLAALMLFQRVGLDLAPRAAEGFTFEEALRCGIEYLPSTASETKQVERDLGEQPISGLMAERGLKPADLVDASTEQITHKMVARALKGRRLTANTMGKVLRAWNQATSSEHGQGDLFNYRP